MDRSVTDDGETASSATERPAGVSPAPFPPPSPNAPRGAEAYQRFRSEMLAGGATEEAGPDDLAGGARGLIGIAVIVGLLALLAAVNVWAFVFVFGLLVSVFLHELGHFATARWTGMKVTQFFMCMGPKLWSFRRGEVEYGVRAIPLGAFVRIVGMNNLDPIEPGDEDRAYRYKSYPRRLLVITAGSLMHMLIAVVLLFGIFMSHGRAEQTGQVALRSVAEGSPAARAGLREGDIVVSLGGREVSTADEFVSAVRSHAPGTVVPIEVLRDGLALEIDATLARNPTLENRSVGYLGVSSSSGAIVRQDVGEAARHAITDLGPQAWASVRGVVTALNPVNIVEHLTGTSDDPDSRPTTVVGVTRFSGEFGDQEGLAGVLMLLAGVNVFVAVFNMVPLLPFDGGHAAIATYERVRSRRGRRYEADVAKMMPVAMTVIVLLAFLLFTGLYIDVTRPL